MAKKAKKRGVKGRTWKRVKRHVLNVGDVDKSGLLTVVNPDVGTKNRHRYALVHCGCGCNVSKRVRIDNFMAGEVSSDTRKKAQRKRFMQNKLHIDNMRLIGKVLLGVKLPETAIAAAREYALRLTNDAQLQEEVRLFNCASLAKRDIERARQLAAVSSTPALKEGWFASPGPAAPTPAVVKAPSQLQMLSQQLRNEMPAVFERLRGFKQLTPENILKALSGDLAECPGYSPVDNEPPAVAPVVAKKPTHQHIEMGELPYELTEEGEDATQAYWNKYKHAPPEGFDLQAFYKEWWKPTPKEKEIGA